MDGTFGMKEILNVFNSFLWDMGSRDKRYGNIKPMFKVGKIKYFNDIFQFVPKTIVATDLGKKVDRFSVLMKRIDRFTLEELFMVASFCSLNEKQMIKLVMNEYFQQKGEPDKQNDKEHFEK